MSAGAGERRVALQERRLDHQRIGAAHWLDQRRDLLGIADDSNTGAEDGRSTDHLRRDTAAVSQEH